MRSGKGFIAHLDRVSSGTSTCIVLLIELLMVAITACYTRRPMAAADSIAPAMTHSLPEGARMSLTGWMCLNSTGISSFGITEIMTEELGND